MKLIIAILIFVLISCNAKHSEKAAVNNSESQGSAANISYKPGAVIKCERIDGPANIRMERNGKLLFVLNDNAPVSATEPENLWLQVGILARLTQKEKDSSLIWKGSKIFTDEEEVGQAIDDIHLTSILSTNEGFYAELTGYTAVSNIRPNSVVENAFSSIVNSNDDSLTIDAFRPFLKDFEFREFDGLLPHFKGYEIDENWIDDPSPLLRLWLVFNDGSLVGVFHSRPLTLIRSQPIKVKRGFYFTALTKSQSTIDSLVQGFNVYIQGVD